jgi:opacity protein-like surface antigen
MRQGIAALGLGLLGTAAFSSHAAAADMAAAPPVLRGALPVQEAANDWSGFYAGGFGGFSQMEFEPRNGAVGLVRRMLSSTVYLDPGRADDVVIDRRTTSNKVIFGGFVGYNWMIDDYVVGAELDYTRGEQNGTATGSANRRFSVPNSTTVPRSDYRYSVNVLSKLKLTEFGTARLRFGVPFGSFMPFATAGVALGRFSYRSEATATGESRNVSADINGLAVFGPWTPDLNASLSDASRTRFAVGYALGAGFDWALTQNIFLRAELQHVRFGNTGDMTASINTARAGAALKF